MKRFTETTIWEKPWFRRLKPEAKLLWRWLVDKCDAAGVIDMDLELCCFQTGCDIDEGTVNDLGDRVVKLDSGKLFVIDFIEFQYGTLSAECKPHKPVIELVKKHQLEKVWKGFQKGIRTLQEKDKEKDKEKDEVEMIYEAYPRKVGKEAGLKAIKAALMRSKMTPAGMLEAVNAFALAMKDEDPQFIPHPATWFNRGSFSDDRVAWNSSASRSQNGVEKKESGAVVFPRYVKPEKPVINMRVRLHPRLPEPGCDWRAVLKELYPPEECPDADYVQPWGLYDPSIREEIVKECQAKRLLPNNWKQLPVPDVEETEGETEPPEMAVVPGGSH